MQVTLQPVDLSLVTVTDTVTGQVFDMPRLQNSKFYLRIRMTTDICML